MMPIPFSPGARAVLLSALSFWLPATTLPAAQQGNLRRLAPGAEVRDPKSLQDLFDRDFDRQRWQERLQEKDLDQRERNLAAIVKRASLDPVARAFLEERARDPQGGELAWTARLALRELGRSSFSLEGYSASPLTSPLASDPFAAIQHMQQVVKEMFTQDGLGLTLQRRDAASPARPAPAARSLRIQQDADGALVRITEGANGSARTRSYPGASLEEILHQNPELERDLQGFQLRIAPGTPIDLRFDLGRGAPEGRGERLGGSGATGLPLEPQGISAPILTDRLGVVVRPVGAERAKELGLQETGLLVERTVPGTYAHLLGVLPGDVLLELDGTALVTGEDIERSMHTRRPEAPLTLEWLDELGQRQHKTWQPSDAKR